MGSKVILADDSVTIQKVVGIIFANEGYDLITVATGDAAIAKAREIKPDVMLVDAVMPGKNGYEVCREIRQDPELAHTAILLMTGAFEVVDEEKSRQSGADDFIVKPFESQQLIDVTNRLIALTASRMANPSQVAAPQPVVTPAPVVEAPSVVAAPVLPPAAPPVDDIWATGFDDEPEAAPVAADYFTPAAPAAAPIAPEPVKATVEDDLWGAFDMDEIETAPAPVIIAPTPVAADDDFFSFEPEPPPAAPAAVEEEFVLDEIAFDEPSPQTVPTATGFEPVGEQEIFFADVPPQAAGPRAELPAAEDFGVISFEEPAAPLAIAAELTPPDAVIPPPSIEPPAQLEVTAPPVVEPAAAPAAVAAAGSLDEAQLRALLSTVSREVIERIVWEVVPDLAETIIKEEIRKLKAGIA